ncbi:nucleotidyltransferase domain-containing protein [Ottowia sp.]|uniref:nucleotidyltransferase domain-containing protein n=1 Tax=Ottowia sp. TaxID=1898956 RepID=UPI003A8915AF
MTTSAIPFAHPVGPAERQRIMASLANIEAQHDVTVLFACESGSRGWGFASPDSDYDVRFIYAHRLPWYLTVRTGRDVIELPIDDVLDVNGWDLRKALGLLQVSNPTLLEWLRSPIVYRRDAVALAGLNDLARQFFSPVRAWHHYASMARKTYREHLQGEQVRYKKYLYALRPLLAARWIVQHASVPPMVFADLVAATLDAQRDQALLADIRALLDVKMRAGEATTSPRWPGLQAFIEAELNQHAPPESSPAPSGDQQVLDDFLCRSVLAHS